MIDNQSLKLVRPLSWEEVFHFWYESEQEFLKNYNKKDPLSSLTNTNENTENTENTENKEISNENVDQKNKKCFIF